jgi:hypothetical protein
MNRGHFYWRKDGDTLTAYMDSSRIVNVCVNAPGANRLTDLGGHSRYRPGPVQDASVAPAYVARG